MTNKLSFQLNIKSTTNLLTKNIEEIFQFIKTGACSEMNSLPGRTMAIQKELDHDLQNAMKMKYLPYACFNGLFSERNENGLLEYSPYTAIDFDQFNSEKELKNIGYWLTQTPYVKFFFRSPSGKGLKVIVEHTNTNPKKHRSLYNELLACFKIPQLDTKTSDLSRATYLCYSPDAWWNGNCQPYPFDESKYSDDKVLALRPSTSVEQPKPAVLPQDKIEYFNLLSRPEGSKISDKDIKNIVRAWINNENPRQGERNQSLFRYSCVLCKAGIKYEYALQLFDDVYGKLGLDVNEIHRTALNGYNHCIDQWGIERDSVFRRQ